jgi:hypothetical protein
VRLDRASDRIADAEIIFLVAVSTRSEDRARVG